MSAAKTIHVLGDLSPSLPSLCEEAKLGRWASLIPALTHFPDVNTKTQREEAT